MTIDLLTGDWTLADLAKRVKLAETERDALAARLFEVTALLNGEQTAIYARATAIDDLMQRIREHGADISVAEIVQFLEAKVGFLNGAAA